MKAKAAVDEAQRQLDHATVRAPFDGTVGEVDCLQPGTLVISALSAFTTTSAVGLIGKDIWIESDMKETDLTHVRAGEPVDITVDTYPGCKWQGHVDSVSAGSRLQPSRPCRRKTAAATGSRWCSAFPCASPSTRASATGRCAPA